MGFFSKCWIERKKSRLQGCNEAPPITTPLLFLLPSTLNKQSRRVAAPQCDYPQQAGTPDPDLQMCDGDTSLCDQLLPLL